MQKIRQELEKSKQMVKEAPHPIFKYYNFPLRIFNQLGNRDYSKYSVVIKQKGGRNYYLPFGWVRFGLQVEDPDRVFTSSTCVGFYTADIMIIKEISTTGRFPKDDFGGTATQYVYLTPFIDHLEFSGRPCEVPKDLGLIMGGNSKFRVVLQCRVSFDLIVEIPDPSPYYSQSIWENSIWRVPADRVTPYAICLKQLQ